MPRPSDSASAQWSLGRRVWEVEPRASRAVRRARRRVLSSRVVAGWTGAASIIVGVLVALAGCYDARGREAGTIRTIAGTGERGSGPADLYLPMDVAIGPDGLVYVAD